MPKVIDSLVDSSKLPLSLIIIGVGGAKFDKMQILDGDTALVSSGGVKAERDLV